MAEENISPTWAPAEIAELDVHIARILSEVDIKSARDIVEAIELDIDDDCIEEAKNLVFRVAHGRYMSELENNGIHVEHKASAQTLQVKKRRGQNAKRADATDLLELYMYTEGHKKEFPRDVLTSVKNFVEMHSSSPNSSPRTVGMQNGQRQSGVQVSNHTEWHIKIGELANKLRIIQEDFVKEKKAKDIVIKRLTDDIGALRTELATVKQQCDSQKVTHTEHVNTAESANDSAASVLTTNSTCSSTNSPARAHETAITEQSVTTEEITEQSSTNANGNAQLTDPKDSSAPAPAEPIEDIDGARAATGDNVNDNAMPSNSTEALPGHVDQKEKTEDKEPVRKDSTSSSSSGGGSSSSSSSSSPPPASYSEALQIPGDWNLAVNKRQKKKLLRQTRQKEDTRVRPNSTPQSKQTPTANKLQGRRPVAGVQLYLEHLNRGDNDTEETITKMVRQYARSKQLRIMSARVVLNRVCDDMVGCRISVPLSQVDTALSPDFWPEDVNCRKWENKPRRRMQARDQRQTRSADDSGNTERRRYRDYSRDRGLGQREQRPYRDNSRDGRQRELDDRGRDGQGVTCQDDKPQFMFPRGNRPRTDKSRWVDDGYEPITDASFHVEDYEEAWKSIRDEAY